MTYTEDQYYNKAVNLLEKSEKSDDEKGYKIPEKQIVIADLEKDSL